MCVLIINNMRQLQHFSLNMNVYIHTDRPAKVNEEEEEVLIASREWKIEKIDKERQIRGRRKEGKLSL